MRYRRSLPVSGVFLLIGVVTAVWLWPNLPAQVPSHWNIHGQVDGTLPRFWAVTWPLSSVVLLSCLTVLLPVISPNRFRIEPFASVFTGLMLVAQGFSLVLGILMLLAGAGYALPMPKLAMLGAGAFMTILGNYMGKLRRNFFIGIRTPWTIASEATWERTHRMAGKLFVLAGALVVIAVLLGLALWIDVVCIVLAVCVPVLYSFVVYRRIEQSPRH